MDLFEAIVARKMGGGSGGVSSWNDLADKPFGEEGGVVEVLPETTVAIAAGSGQGMIESKIPFTVGETYTVNWNGIEYVCVAQDASATEEGAVVIGNATAIGLAGNGEPFVIIPGANYGTYVMSLDGSTEVVLSICEGSMTIHPIPGKYLPKGTPWIEEGEMVEVLPETTLEVNEEMVSAPISDVLDVSVGDQCVINYNGTEFTCEAQSFDMEGITLAALGDIGAASGEPIGSYPFLIMVLPSDLAAEQGAGAEVIPLDGSTTFSLSIKKGAATIHPIDPRCLDLAWLPTVSKTGTVLFNAQTITAGTIDIKFTASDIGKTVTVECDGKQYDCVIRDESGSSGTFAFSFGNGYIANPSDYADTGEPFVVFGGDGVTNVVFTDSNAHSFGIYQAGANKLPAEFLPDDATSYTLVSPNGTKYSITVSDDGTLSATAI